MRVTLLIPALLLILPRPQSFPEFMFLYNRAQFLHLSCFALHSAKWLFVTSTRHHGSSEWIFPSFRAKVVPISLPSTLFFPHMSCVDSLLPRIPLRGEILPSFLEHFCLLCVLRMRPSLGNKSVL